MNSNSKLKRVINVSEAYASLSGPLNQFHISLSINRNTGLERRLTVISQGKRSVFVRYLWGKLLWDELNNQEMRIFWMLPDITSELSIYLGLKALALGLSRKLLRKRLQNGKILGFKFITRQQYLSIKGQCDFFFKEEIVILRPVTKYSGYTKHYKDKGSLGPPREYYLSEAVSLDVSIENDILLQYLVVGEIPLLGGVINLP